MHKNSRSVPFLRHTRLVDPKYLRNFASLLLLPLFRRTFLGTLSKLIVAFKNIVVTHLCCITYGAYSCIDHLRWTIYHSFQLCD